MKENDFCLISTAMDDLVLVEELSRELLKKRLVACIQSHEVQSRYRWQGKIEVNKEILLTMKTRRSLFSKVKKEIKKIHSYDVPEIIMIPILDGNKAYLDWIREETS